MEGDAHHTTRTPVTGGSERGNWTRLFLTHFYSQSASHTTGHRGATHGSVSIPLEEMSNNYFVLDLHLILKPQ